MSAMGGKRTLAIDRAIDRLLQLLGLRVDRLQVDHEGGDCRAMPAEFVCWLLALVVQLSH